MTDKIIKPKNALNDSLPTPLYHQIYVLMREKIFSGVYPNGSLLPTENELEKMFGVSRITVKRAMDELAAEGLVSRQRGRGTTVTFSNPVSSSSGTMDGLMGDLLNIALETSVNILEFDYVKAPPHATDALQLPPSSIVQKAIRTRHKDETPFSYVITYVPEDIGRSFSYEELENKPILALIERAGIVISRAKQTITATLADDTTGPALNVTIGSPLLKVARIVYDEYDRPVEYITIYYRPDLYQLNLELSRVVGETSNFWSAQQE
ncbi:GntR family transcriptional regulator [Luteithermobacter gelatinilyticus]|uniref:GntR family transcriptional regulator n=1 Tax=Luteithermobacter gelatinilyticus TaxID=2582913 RepID=UPI00143D1E31|nr:GntR family transcriptional regulator [Luteithermobacter gelatinilyticus]